MFFRSFETFGRPVGFGIIGGSAEIEQLESSKRLMLQECAEGSIFIASTMTNLDFEEANTLLCQDEEKEAIARGVSIYRIFILEETSYQTETVPTQNNRRRMQPNQFYRDLMVKQHNLGIKVRWTTFEYLCRHQLDSLPASDFLCANVTMHNGKLVRDAKIVLEQMLNPLHSGWNSFSMSVIPSERRWVVGFVSRYFLYSSPI